MKPDVVTTGPGEVDSKSKTDHIDQIPSVEDEAQGRIVEPSVSDKTFAASTPPPELTIEPDVPGGEYV